MTEDELFVKFDTWPLLRGHIDSLKEKLALLNQDGARIQMHFKRLQKEYDDWERRLHFLDNDMLQLEKTFGIPRDAAIDYMKNHKAKPYVPQEPYIPGSALSQAVETDDMLDSVFDALDVKPAAPTPVATGDSFFDDILNL